MPGNALHWVFRLFALSTLSYALSMGTAMAVSQPSCKAQVYACVSKHALALFSAAESEGQLAMGYVP